VNADLEGDPVDRMVAEWGRAAPGLDVSALHVVGRLFRCTEHAQRALVAALAPLGLSYADFDVLNTMRRRALADGISPGELARSSLVTSGAMTARLDRLHRAGLVDRDVAPHDRRGVLVRLTPAGEETAKRALDRVLAADEEILAPFGPEQRDTLAGLLRVLLRHVEPGQ
jgi:DNA-binding MarR family transcriptional regulator